MKTLPSNKLMVSTVSAILFLIASLTFSSAAFSQSKEFLRLRATSEGTIPTTEDLTTDSNPNEYQRIRTSSDGSVSTPGSLTNDSTGAEYYIAPGDVLDVLVWNNPDLSKEVTVRGDGKLGYPLAGTFVAAGLSIDQLQNLMTKKLAAYIRAPQVIVSLKSSAGNKIVVLGQVNYPGVFTFRGRINLIDAIGMAGDFTPDGRRESVMIITGNFTMHPKVRKVNALDALRKGIFSKDFMLKPNDVVYVPRSTIADFNKFLNEIQPTISTLSNVFTAGQTGVNAATSVKGFFWHRNVKVISGD